MRTSSSAEKCGLPSVTLVGYGNWGAALARALHESGVSIREIVVRAPSHRGSRGPLRVPAPQVTADRAALDAAVLWICTPDRAISGVAVEIAGIFKKAHRRRLPVVFHSSGALGSSELSPLRALNIPVAAVHPLMTFPPAAQAMRICFEGISFALEGDARACRIAAKLVRAMKGEPFLLLAQAKALYHAFGAFTSPLLIALLEAAVEVAAMAGLKPAQARRRMRPIVEQTVTNFFTEGAAKSFSGPLPRGDADTIGRHLAELHPHKELSELYRSISRFALSSLPSRNTEEIRKLLNSPDQIRR